MELPADLVVRPEATRDHEAIAQVVEAAFGSPAEAHLVDRIRSSPEYEPSTSLVAELDGEIVGHVMISGAVLRNDAGARTIAMLSPLAVAPDRQRLGIGMALVESSVEIAEQRGEPIVILEGDPRYYGRMGFEHSTRYGIEIHLPDWAPPEAAQVRRLASFDPGDPTLRGEVIYPPAFDGLD